jgi:hypothetical protein
MTNGSEFDNLIRSDRTRPKRLRVYTVETYAQELNIDWAYPCLMSHWDGPTDMEQGAAAFMAMSDLDRVCMSQVSWELARSMRRSFG